MGYFIIAYWIVLFVVSRVHVIFLVYNVNNFHFPSFKVTRLERDASSGTALQEISFWFNLENALSRIQRKRDSAEVNLTLDVLKAGKRFHATVSFDSDTGTCTYM